MTRMNAPNATTARTGDRRFWVIGGEYADTAFSRVIPGTERVVGPLPSREEALSVWRRLSEEGRPRCLVRYAIAAE